MKTTHKTIAQFEEVHAQPKIKALQRQVEAEKAKVEALAGVQNRVTVEKRADCHIRFALVSDPHFGSLYAHTDAFSAFYEFAEDQEVEAVYNCGDVLDGHRIYKGQEFELRDIGVEAQCKRLAKLPKSPLKTRFIVGNHDQSFKQAAGVHVGRAIEAVAPGWEFLGEEQARVVWETPEGPFSLMLIHPGGGTSYALSYRPQKIVESLEGGSKPDVLGIGHYHKAEYIPSYRNVAIIQGGTFQRQTPFMARQGLAAHVGGWIVDVVKGEGHNRIKAEFVAFYV